MVKNPGENSSRQKSEGRLARHRRIAREVYAQPRSLGGHIRDGFLSVWIARGAGFYGLGWILAFLVLEINMFSSELAESDGVGEFVGGQLIEYVLRVGFLSVVNSLLAFIWPAYLLEWLSGYGFLVLIGGYFGFERVVRPLVEGHFPELREAREARAARARKKALKKKPNTPE